MITYKSINTCGRHEAVSTCRLMISGRPICARCGGEVWQETVNSPQSYPSSNTLSGELARGFGNLEWRAHERVPCKPGAMLEHHYFHRG